MSPRESAGQSHRARPEVPTENAVARSGEHKAELDAEVDDLLDEIDDVLEENAEEFVRGFVQKGGQ